MTWHNIPLALISLLLASAALIMALISQYGFGTHPCDLCLVQRYPYGAIIICSLIMLAVKHASLRFVIMIVIIGACATTSSVGIYHVAVEQGWVQGPDGCSIVLNASESVDDLKLQILAAPLVSCSDVGASFAGLSMAAWNALYGMICCIILTRLWYIQRKKPRI